MIISWIYIIQKEDIKNLTSFKKYDILEIV